MDDFEITRQGIVIIQWLKYDDPQLGEELYNKIRHKEQERENYFVTFYKVQTKTEFIKVLQDLIDNTKRGTLFTLHIVAHGNESCIGISSTEYVTWKELFNYTRELNIIMGNNLLLVLSSCVGGGILSYIEPEKRAPYRAVLPDTRQVLMSDAHIGFSAFYANYYNILDFSKSLEALNTSIDFSKDIDGQKKTEFFVMTAEHSFDEVFNPERDPVFFESVVNKILPINDHIPQELRIIKAKEIFKRKGDELRPYFTFND